MDGSRAKLNKSVFVENVTLKINLFYIRFAISNLLLTKLCLSIKLDSRFFNTLLEM